MVPRSISRVTDSAVKISIVMVRMVPTRPGTMLSCVAAAGLYRACVRTSNSGVPLSGNPRSCASAVCTSCPKRSERRTRRHRIGGVGRHQDRRLFAAAHRAFEVTRNLDREQHLAGGEHAIELRLVMKLARDLEVFGVFEGLQNRPADVARFLEQHRGRQIARRGVDGVTEQQKLHQRHHDDHGERNAVAAKLDELLDQHRRCGAKLLCKRAVDSSRSLEIVLGAAHQIDEHVLERGLGMGPVQRGSSR